MTKGGVRKREDNNTKEVEEKKEFQRRGKILRSKKRSWIGYGLKYSGGGGSMSGSPQ